MTATETAIKIIKWAINDTGPPPRGDLRKTRALANPSQSLSLAMQTLTTITAAQMCFDSPPLGDKQPLGVGSAILAAAIGARDSPTHAQQIIKTIPPANHPAEWIIRHALASRILPFLNNKTAETLSTHDCLLASPLTALLNTPVPSQQNTLIELVYQLIEHPTSRRWLQLNLAKPTSDTATRRWRQELLGQLRQTEGDKETTFVLDVYETLAIHHSEEAFKQVYTARSVLLDPIAAADENRLQQALSIANWWKPLWELRRSRNNELRKRLYLGYQYLEGLELYTLAQKLITQP
jgi:hypothetical protein